MKTHSQDFKNEICLLGKQQEILITYTENQTEKTLTGEDINSAVPHYEADLLKSVMKELDLDSNTDIPINTEINFKYGLLVNGEYEYIDFGNYIVFSSEKQEDTYSYNIKCYDKIIFSMKPYKTMNVQYPITIKNYINSICNYLGLGFANVNDTFTNYDKQIPAELYLDTDGNDLGYTFRDVLDELAQVTGSVICLNNNDQIEIRYPNPTNDIINEEYLKDVNVKFGETYGPINTVVLSRSAGSDKISLSTPENLPDNQKIAVEIRDNQIMNFNNRDEFLPGLLGRLYGTEYYLNDFTSTGIVYYDLLDKYSVQVGENIYNCLMLNNEINITQGLEEQIYTKKPETAETDYTKTDKTDRRINQTYLIVDKQNQKIESVVSNVTQQNNKISQITQTVNEINSKIEDIADITTSAESIYATISLERINQSEPIELKVRPAGENISYLYPHPNLFPSSNLYLKTRTIRFIRTYEEGGETLTQNIDYILPDDLLYYDNDTYDEFYLNYDSQTCQVIKRCKYNADGTVGLLDNEITTDYEYPQILLYDGDYEIKILGYNSGYISARLMAQNIYTTQFATKAELSSSITQTKGEINLSVNEKLNSYPTKTEMNSSINIKANEITSSVSANYTTKTELNTAKSEIKQTTDSISSTVSTKVGNNEVISKINQSSESVQINANKINLNGKTIDLTGDNIRISSNNFNVDKNGNMTCTNAHVSGTISSTNATITGGKISLIPTGGTDVLRVIRNNDTDTMAYMTDNVIGINNGDDHIECYCLDDPRIELFREGDSETIITYEYVKTPEVIQTSLEEQKKNFEKFNGGLDIIKNTDIYKYNLKSQKDGDKKHIGFVIGKNYKYSKEITSKNNDGVDTYSMISVAYKAIQEQQELIESLQRQIDEMKGDK